MLNTAVRGAAGRLAPFAIGMTVTICILMFGALTGGSVNPARTIGPAVATGLYNGIAVYLVAQLLGGIVAGLLYRVFWAPQSASAKFETAHAPASRNLADLLAAAPCRRIRPNQGRHSTLPPIELARRRRCH